MLFPRNLPGPFAVVLALTLLSAAACVASVTLAPGADKVRVVENPADVVGCKMIGEVSVQPAPFSEKGTYDKLRNATFALGGNVVLHTFGGALTGGRKYQGTAYVCG
jgi:hypothetical protein